MPRPLRIEYEHAYYHVMNRGRGRKTIFHNKDYYLAFLQTLEEAVQRFGMVLHAYCLMGNHYHLLLETPKSNLSRIMRHINGVYTQRYNRLKRTDGPLFRGRYKAIVVDADAYLLQLSRYIHCNPIETKTPLVKKLEQYTWSSYSAYIGKTKAPGWLTRQQIYAMLGKQARGYQSFVELGVDEELQRFYSRDNVHAILGDKVFREKALSRNRSQLTEPQQRKAAGRPTLNRVIKTVMEVFEVERSTVVKKQRGKQAKNDARKVAMYLVQQLCDARLTELCEYFGVNHVGSVSNTISVVNRRLGDEKKLERQVRRAMNMIQAT